MNKIFRKLERKLVATYEFWQNFVHYLQQGHRLRKAWQMAGVTLP